MKQRLMQVRIRLSPRVTAALVFGVLVAPQASAATQRAKFETYGFVCERKGQTYFFPKTRALIAEPDPNIAVPDTLELPACKTNFKVTGFKWSRVDRSKTIVTESGARYTMLARITGTVTGSTMRVTDLQTTGFNSTRFDGYSLTRPGLIFGAIIARSWPSTCNLTDSAVLSQQVAEQSREPLAAALKDDPELRVRTLVNGATEIVTYKPRGATIDTLATSLNATVCVETDTTQVSADQVTTKIQPMKLKAEALDAKLPSGRAIVLVIADRISMDQKKELSKTFGSQVALDSGIRTSIASSAR